MRLIKERGEKMRIPKQKWKDLVCRVERIEKELQKQKCQTEEEIQYMAKRILEEPDVLSEEIKSIEAANKFIDEFIHS